MSRKRKNQKGDRISIKGFFRVQIQDKETGKIVGDTGYMANQITNYGLANCLVGGPAGAGSTVQIAGAMLGSGTNPASDATALDGALTDYYSTVGEAINGSTQAQFTQSYDGTLGAATLANIGLLAASDGSVIAGKTYASSALATTQSVNMTYNLNYTTS
jgi:hypothetical protein